MSTTVRAKFAVQSVTETLYGTSVELSAVYSTSGENADFTDATPSGQLKIQISKGRPAAEVFKVGKAFYLDFTEVPPAAPAAPEVASAAAPDTY